MLLSARDRGRTTAEQRGIVDGAVLVEARARDVIVRDRAPTGDWHRRLRSAHARRDRIGGRRRIVALRARGDCHERHRRSLCDRGCARPLLRFTLTPAHELAVAGEGDALRPRVRRVARRAPELSGLGERAVLRSRRGVPVRAVASLARGGRGRRDRGRRAGLADRRRRRCAFVAGGARELGVRAREWAGQAFGARRRNEE